MIALDADLNRITADALIDFGNSNRNIDVRLILNEYKQKERTVELVLSKEQLLADMMNSIREGKRCFVTSNSKKRVEEIKVQIEADFNGTIPLRIITSDNSQAKDTIEFIKNIKKEILNIQVLLTSPALGTGIDISFDDEINHVEHVYGIFETRVNTHYDIDQQLSRVRNPKHVRVWVSKERFNFETEQEAIKHNLLENGLVPEAIGDYDADGQMSYNLDDPFLNLYANIVSAQRASKNNLHQHFIDLRERNGWKVKTRTVDINLLEEGKRIKLDSKNRLKQQKIEALLATSKISDDEMEQLAEKKKYQKPMSDEELLKLNRAYIELFYRQELTRELLEQDDDGTLRKRVLMLESLFDPRSDKLLAVSHSLKQRSHVKTGDITEATKTAQLLINLLALSDLLTKDGFNSDQVVTQNSLLLFSQYCRKNKLNIEQLLNIDIRRDLESKPVTQLNKFLALIGLKLSVSDTHKIAGKKIYEYRLDEQLLSRMTSLIKIRQLPKKSNKQSDDSLPEISIF